MGICGSKVEEEEAVVAEQPDKAPGRSPAKEDGDKKGGSEEGANTDFRETLKAVMILVLNRLVTALEYEQEGFLDLAVKRSKKNYMELIAPQHFEKLLRELFDVDSVKTGSPEVDQSDPNYEQQRFMKLLDACEKAEYKTPIPSVDKLVASVQKATKATQQELRDSAIASESSDLKIHLFFFAKALDVVTGDIASHPELLYSNIDDMCDKS